jgi:ubiquinol-cytochrome c reductase cytochrome c1 subunit
MKKLTYIVLLISFSWSSVVLASGGGAELAKISIDPLNRTESLQNGAKLYINYCLGCHSAKYVRYERIAQDLEIDIEDLKANLMFTSEKVGDPLTIALDHQQAKAWFGAVPPDLSLEARLRGPDWVYAYLTGFYPDESRPFGYNNKVFPSVGMPHVLEGMQKDLSEVEYNKAVYDITNFMDYMAEPIKKERIELGRWVIAFLVFLFLPVTLWLNHEYWKNVH